MNIRILLTTFLLTLVLDSCTKKQTDLATVVQEGDIIFQNLIKSPDQNIWTAMKSEYNHVGIIMKHNNDWQVYTVDSLVRYISLNNFVARGAKKKYLIMRMIYSDGMIDKSLSHEIKNAAKRYQNLTYDYRLSIDNQQIYEPELIWKMYYEAFMTELGDIQTISNIDLSSSGVQEYIAHNFDGQIPSTQEVITMDQILYSNVLRVVAEN